MKLSECVTLSPTDYIIAAQKEYRKYDTQQKYYQQWYNISHNFLASIGIFGYFSIIDLKEEDCLYKLGMIDTNIEMDLYVYTYDEQLTHANIRVAAFYGNIDIKDAKTFTIAFGEYLEHLRKGSEGMGESFEQQQMDV